MDDRLILNEAAASPNTNPFPYGFSILDSPPKPLYEAFFVLGDTDIILRSQIQRRGRDKVLGDEVELTSLCINMPYCAWGIASSSPTWECL